ncbi:MAG: Nascent polypeptide associated complex NAC [Methanobacterium sp. Maddingley MBC34]|nr:MAG: Nascent polypeptide associated complex NAC [Methanobacterium sp. Maddingley MBC34]
MLPSAGMNPKQLKQMQRAMKQMGMDTKDVKGVTEVIIKFKNKELVITNPKVNLMNFMGQDTYQISGKSKERAIETELVIPDDDVDLVATQAGVSPEEARKALEETGGDLAEAILRLS